MGHCVFDAHPSEYWLPGGGVKQMYYYWGYSYYLEATSARKSLVLYTLHSVNPNYIIKAQVPLKINQSTTIIPENFPPNNQQIRLERALPSQSGPALKLATNVRAEKPFRASIIDRSFCLFRIFSSPNNLISSIDPSDQGIWPTPKHSHLNSTVAHYHAHLILSPFQPKLNSRKINELFGSPSADCLSSLTLFLPSRMWDGGKKHHELALQRAETSSRVTAVTAAGAHGH